MNRSRSAADPFWVWLPRRSSRISPIVGVALADGSYFRAWTPAAWLAPPVAGTLGLVLGIWHPGEVYTYSLGVMIALGLVSGLGAALGSWAVVGFVVGDAGVAALDATAVLALTADLDGIRAAGALLLSYVLLAGLLVLIPVIASTARVTVLGRMGGHLRGVAVSGGVLVTTQVVLAFLWTQSTPFLIRPIWSYSDRTPSVEAISSLQSTGWAVAGAVGLGAVGRLLMERRAAVRLDPVAIAGSVRRLRKPLSWWAAVIGRTTFVTFMLSGLLTTWWSAGLTAAALAGIFTLQLRVLPACTGLAAVVGRIPLIVRLAAVVALAYGAGQLLVQRAVDDGSDSFISLVLATLASLLVAAVLPPAPGASPQAPLMPRPGR